MPSKVWAVGEEVLAADFNTYVQQQVVATFPNAAARDAAIGAPSEGMVCYLADANVLQVYDGAAWRLVSAAPYLTPQTFIGDVQNGTATAFTVFLNQPAILTAPYPLRMIVSASGDLGANSNPHRTDITVRDEAGATIAPVHGTRNVGAVQVFSTVADSNNVWSIMGVKDYNAGQVCGFQLAYKVDVSNIYIGASAVVAFYPR